MSKGAKPCLGSLQVSFCRIPTLMLQLPTDIVVHLASRSLVPVQLTFEMVSSSSQPAYCSDQATSNYYSCPLASQGLQHPIVSRLDASYCTTKRHLVSCCVYSGCAPNGVQQEVHSAFSSYHVSQTKDPHVCYAHTFISTVHLQGGAAESFNITGN